VSVADDVRQQITKRLKQLKPLVDEYHQLEEMVRKLATGGGASSSPVRSSTRARSTRSTIGRRRGRPSGSGTRSAQALALVQAKPGITIPEMAKEMGITPNYLYRVLPELAKDGKVKKNGKGWESAS
jgi:CRP-like cAMP-binding protein